MAVNLFANATAVSPTKAVTKKSSAKDVVQLSGLEQLAQINALMKALDGVKTSIEQGVKSDAFEHFFAEAQATAKRPDNFKGVDGIASASIEMRKRSTASALSDDEVAMFKANSLEVEKVVSVQQLFAINPTYAADSKLLKKVSAALADIVPADFIQVQEERSKFVVGDDTMDAAFKNKAPREIIEAITVMAVKSKLEVTNIGSIMDSLKTLLVVTPKAD